MKKKSKSQKKKKMSVTDFGPPSYRVAKAEFEKEYLRTLLEWSNGNVQRAARRAERDRKGLYILMAKYGIDPNDFRNKKKAKKQK